MSRSANAGKKSAKWFTESDQQTEHVRKFATFDLYFQANGDA